MSVLRGWEKRGTRRVLIILIYALAFAPLVIYGAVNALSSNANSPLDWVDESFGPKVQYNRFVSRFGQGDLLMVSWPGCTVYQARLDQLAERLRTAPGFYDEDEWLFDRVFTGREFFQRLTSPPFSLPEAVALERMQGWLVGPDQKSTCAIIAFNSEGLQRRSLLVPLIHRLASEYGQVLPSDVHLAGPVADGYSVDVAGRRTMDRFAPISAMVVYLVCLLSIRSFFVATLVFICAVISQGLALAVMHFTGGTSTALTIVLPPLVQVLSIAGGVHLTNYSMEQLSHSDPDQAQAAIARAVRIGWLPCVLSSITTAIGMGSLAASGIVAVREFGIFAAIGVLMSTGCLLLLLPFGMGLRPPRKEFQEQSPHSGGFVNWCMVRLQRYHLVIVVVGIAVTCGFAVGISRLQASVSIETLFSPESRLIRDYEWLEENVAPLVPIEAVVDFSSNRISIHQQLECITEIERALERRTGVISVTSPLALMPATPDAAQDSSALRYVEASLFDLARSMNYSTGSIEAPQWRITARVSALGGEKYDEVLREIRQDIADVFQTQTQWHLSRVEITGLMPLVHEIQNQLFLDLFSSFLTAFAIIAVVMSIVQAGFAAGLITMIPNVFPSVLMFGVLGWLGKPVDIGSMMTASIAMGIAVDDTLHFINYFQHKMRAGDSVFEALAEALRHCGLAMIQTTLICSCGLVVFAMSDFAPTANFAWMMVSLLLIALVGDLVLLPAILLSPAGKLLWITEREFPEETRAVVRAGMHFDTDAYDE